MKLTTPLLIVSVLGGHMWAAASNVQDPLRQAFLSNNAAALSSLCQSASQEALVSLATSVLSTVNTGSNAETLFALAQWIREEKAAAQAMAVALPFMPTEMDREVAQAYLRTVPRATLVEAFKELALRSIPGEALLAVLGEDDRKELLAWASEKGKMRAAGRVLLSILGNAEPQTETGSLDDLLHAASEAGRWDLFDAIVAHSALSDRIQALASTAASEVVKHRILHTTKDRALEDIVGRLLAILAAMPSKTEAAHTLQLVAEHHSKGAADFLSKVLIEAVCSRVEQVPLLLEAGADSSRVIDDIRQSNCDQGKHAMAEWFQMHGRDVPEGLVKATK